MARRGWNKIYLEIVREFGYSQKRDAKSARVLHGILGKTAEGSIREAVEDRTVFVIGSGPSIAMATRMRLDGTVMAADSATGYLIRHGIRPDIVTTDLDGGRDALREASKTATMVVHAHGDNNQLLHMARSYQRCVGSCQAGSTAKVHNFGGFTDGDRAVFLADHFGAARIILVGMDFDRIGPASNTTRADRPLKLKKLQAARKSIGWLARYNGAILSATPGGGIREFETRV